MWYHFYFLPFLNSHHHVSLEHPTNCNIVKIVACTLFEYYLSCYSTIQEEIDILHIILVIPHVV